MVAETRKINFAASFGFWPRLERCERIPESVFDPRRLLFGMSAGDALREGFSTVGRFREDGTQNWRDG